MLREFCCKYSLNVVPLFFKVFIHDSMVPERELFDDNHYLFIITEAYDKVPYRRDGKIV